MLEIYENVSKSGSFSFDFNIFQTQTGVNNGFYARMRALLSFLRNIPQQIWLKYLLPSPN
jgi:hypothetical protein